MRRISTPAPLTPEEADALLRDKMAELQQFIEAVATEAPDCDMKLAGLLDGEQEQVRIAIIDKLRTLLRERAEEKEQELEKHLETQKRQEISQQQNRFRQWLSWIMSEETLRKIREAFLARPMLELYVKNLGQNLAQKGIQTQQAQTQDLGLLAANISQSMAARREKEKQEGKKGV